MTLYLMKKYYQPAIDTFGDELSLHYHTFVWTDYDQDGNYWWNQALDFNESRDDFDVTLAQFLLEEKTFPVSFRSGWHYMDNHWQNYLNDLLPYSMHNDYPNIHTDFEEPTDNNYDWSQSPGSFQPYHPSPENYQIPGESKSWNLRSTHFSTARYHDLMDSLFVTAHNSGKDQIICLWGHLPELGFLDNVVILDSLAHKMDRQYDDVTFEYVTAVEGMQKYLQATDSIAPVINYELSETSTETHWTVTSNEPVFQASPILACQDVYGNYKLISGVNTGDLRWEYTLSMPPNIYRQMGYCCH